MVTTHLPTDPQVDLFEEWMEGTRGVAGGGGLVVTINTLAPSAPVIKNTGHKGFSRVGAINRTFCNKVHQLEDWCRGFLPPHLFRYTLCVCL